MKRYYLAYGSNLNLEQMKYRCKTARKIGSIILPNYRLVYKGRLEGYSYLTVEHCEGEFVPLGVFEITCFDELSLDVYEGYPNSYLKKYIPIKIGDNVIYGLIYVMNEKCDYNLPSEKYVEICKKGYEDFGFDKSILDKALITTKGEIDNINRKRTKE